MNFVKSLFEIEKRFEIVYEKKFEKRYRNVYKIFFKEIKGEHIDIGEFGRCYCPATMKFYSPLNLEKKEYLSYRFLKATQILLDNGVKAYREDISDLNALLMIENGFMLYFKEKGFLEKIIRKMEANASLPFMKIDFNVLNKKEAYTEKGETFFVNFNNNILTIDKTSFALSETLFNERLCYLSDESGNVYELKAVSFDFEGNPVFTLTDKTSKELVYRFAIRSDK